jgi:hypothetical protein
MGRVLSLLAFGRQAAAFCSVTCGCTGSPMPIAILRGLAASGTSCTRSTWSMLLSSLAPAGARQDTATLRAIKID